VQYQDDPWDDMSPPMNISFISKAMQPTLRGGSHKADECKQTNRAEQVCLSGGDVYDDPSLLRFYQNDDTLPYGNSKRKEKGEDGLEWIIRILEMDEDELVPIILERPFLVTARAVIDVYEGKLSLRVESEIVTFNIGKSMKSKHSREDYLYSADHTAKLVQEQWVDTNHKGAIAWSIVNIKWIDSSFCTHKILMEDEFKPSVQTQRRVNPNINECKASLIPFFLGQTPLNNSGTLLTKFDRGAIFHELIEDNMEVFMDNFSIFGSSFDHFLKNLEKMLKRCEETNLVLNWEKCHIMVKEGIVLGHKVSGSGIEVDKAKSRQFPNYHIQRM
nr:hypothetical protein [Tanacetum cinerariifolium]